MKAESQFSRQQKKVFLHRTCKQVCFLGRGMEEVTLEAAFFCGFKARGISAPLSIQPRGLVLRQHFKNGFKLQAPKKRKKASSQRRSFKIKGGVFICKTAFKKALTILTFLFLIGIVFLGTQWVVITKGQNLLGHVYSLDKIINISHENPFYIVVVRNHFLEKFIKPTKNTNTLSSNKTIVEDNTEKYMEGFEKTTDISHDVSIITVTYKDKEYKIL